MATFVVDTHLFRELGEYLVGRDSTALMELIKNSYDADAANVWVYGEALDDIRRGFLLVRDDGWGMTAEQFEKGFLRIASRYKDVQDRRSPGFKRRFTGAKGIGRLAAHKLARVVEVESVATGSTERRRSPAITAVIDWDEIEDHETLDQIGSGVRLRTHKRAAGAKGTTIQLSRLRRGWTDEETAIFLLEAQTFQPPEVLTAPLPRGVFPQQLLFRGPRVREASGRDPGLRVHLEGAFAVGDDYWDALQHHFEWVIETRAVRGKPVEYAIVPTMRMQRELSLKDDPEALLRTYSVDHPQPEDGPFFDSRIFVRGGLPGHLDRGLRRWSTGNAGVRVYLEGFRVLPYGEPRNDWLFIDADVNRRIRGFPTLKELGFDEDPDDRNAALIALPNAQYYGAVFLTEKQAPNLRMLVNREGFVPEGGYRTLVNLVRTGIDLSVRVRASLTAARREQRRRQRRSTTERSGASGAVAARTEFTSALRQGIDYVEKLEKHLSTGDTSRARKTAVGAKEALDRAAAASADLADEAAILRVLASIGLQMAAFIHEVNALVAATGRIEERLETLRQSGAPVSPRRLATLSRQISQLRRSLERQATYLIDVVTPDARRRRSRQSLAKSIDKAFTLVEGIAQRDGVEFENRVSVELKSPPMFPAELVAVFSNLLTNAVKAADEEGVIRATARRRDGEVKLRIQNTGKSVTPEEGERWFSPFESTTVDIDPVLGQGMGLGLPITRRILEEYDCDIRFVQPAKGFSASVEVVFRGVK